MRRCEDEIQTPTIGRTLRSDALGKKTVTVTIFQHTAPNSASRRDALTVEPVRQIQDFRKTIDL